MVFFGFVHLGGYTDWLLQRPERVHGRWENALEILRSGTIVTPEGRIRN